jgi:hypothetical protein
LVESEFQAGLSYCVSRRDPLEVRAAIMRMIERIVPIHPNKLMRTIIVEHNAPDFRRARFRPAPSRDYQFCAGSIISTFGLRLLTRTCGRGKTSRAFAVEIEL